MEVEGVLDDARVVALSACAAARCSARVDGQLETSGSAADVELSDVDACGAANGFHMRKDEGVNDETISCKNDQIG